MKFLRARWPESCFGYRARFSLSGLILSCVLSGCASFGPPSAALQSLLPIAAAGQPGSFAKRNLRVSIHSDTLSGEFQGVAASSSAPSAAVRLQLFGELGGKLFDLVARPKNFVGYFPHAQIGVSYQFGESQLPRHLITFMAVSLLESTTPITAERVLGARKLDKHRGWELELIPVLKGAEVRVVVSPKGELMERRYEVRGVGWTETMNPTRSLRGRNFELTLTEEHSSPVASLPERAFELDLPEGFHP